ncbi:ribosome biogenesis GTPase Der, partial [Candidatus Falkowbacteria bacterium]|nr:ribosome biogenesis GTPase Der [Candidatus Falkowbacteria bacterium]
GKSTVFNRLIEKQQAMISSIPGPTRDLNIGTCEWQGKKIQIVDTAGLDIPQTDDIDAASVKQAKKIFKNAAIIVLVVDAKDGLMPQDKEFSTLLKKTNKPILLVANKTDNPKHRANISDFYKLGLGEPLGLSAKSGAGVGDFLETVLETLETRQCHVSTDESELPAGTLKVSIIGRPNVGKSSLFNAIAGEERAIVSEIPHTTRDTQDVLIEYSHPKLKIDSAAAAVNFLFIDTAGVRRKSKISQRLEKLSVRKALSSIKRADIVLLMLDVTEPISHQDQKLAESIVENRKSVIIVANKWDLVEGKTTKTADEFTKYIHAKMTFLKWAPIVYTAANTGANIQRLLNTIYDVWVERNKVVDDKALEKMLEKMLKKMRPVQARGPERAHIRSISQERANPPIFKIFLKRGKGLHFSYLRFIENQLRKNFGFIGSPIVLRVED